MNFKTIYNRASERRDAQSELEKQVAGIAVADEVIRRGVKRPHRLINQHLRRGVVLDDLLVPGTQLLSAPYAGLKVRGRESCEH